MHQDAPGRLRNSNCIFQKVWGPFHLSGMRHQQKAKKKNKKKSHFLTYSGRRLEAWGNVYVMSIFALCLRLH